MSLTAGTRLGPYEIIGAIGSGGMGDVYRARDIKLNRDVALKVLPEHFTNNAERAARFEREAQTLAALNHPNIAQIYGTEQHALVMEYVPGEDLAARLRHGRIELADALPIARQIVLALEAAHEKSVVHRDLKPANVKVTADGTVKVLDFGLAKAMSSDAGASSGGIANSPTMTSPAVTQHGVILGTAAYMSPEQARGRAVDKRADIWAFGVVLYEMLTGRAAFGGDNVTDVIAGVVTKDPDWTALPAATPPAIRTLIRRCLQKDAKNRLHDIADARLDIDAALIGDADVVAAEPTRVGGPLNRSVGRWPTLASVATLLALVAGVAAGVFWQKSRVVPPVEWTASRMGGPAIVMNPRVSPDGHMLAFCTLVNGQTQVAVMKPGTGNWTVITHDRTHGLVNDLSWAADGSQIYYDRYTDTPNGIYSVPGLGGDERLVVENASSPVSLHDHSLLFLRLNAERAWQLYRLWPDQGKQEALPFVRVTPGLAYYSLVRQLDPDRIVLVGRPIKDTAAGDDLYVVHLPTGEARKISPSLPMSDAIGLTIDSADRSVLLSVRDANTFRLLRIAPDGASRAESLMTFLAAPHPSVSPSGGIYVTTEERPYELLRFTERGASMERLELGTSLTGPGLALPDGRALVTSRIGGKSRVVATAVGKVPVNLVQTDEDTAEPMTVLGADKVAMMFGAGLRDIAVVSIVTGAIVKRVHAPAGVTSLGASPDGTMLYVAAGGSISAVTIDTGASRIVGAGDSFVVDPDTGDLIVKLDEVDRFRLVRQPPAGGAAQPIPIRSSDLRLISESLAAGSIRHGRLLLPVATVDSWNWHPAILTLASGAIERVPLDYDTDFHYVGWSPDGKILGSALGFQGKLWKFERR